MPTWKDELEKEKVIDRAEELSMRKGSGAVFLSGESEGNICLLAPSSIKTSTYGHIWTEYITDSVCDASSCMIHLT